MTHSTWSNESTPSSDNLASKRTSFSGIIAARLIMRAISFSMDFICERLHLEFFRNQTFECSGHSFVNATPLGFRGLDARTRLWLQSLFHPAGMLPIRLLFHAVEHLTHRPANLRRYLRTIRISPVGGVE